ncbi:hypothetical protein ElyMa_006764500 [Elysia marginata]|uniref:Uncharacterized protein n=1 Tax=Elysia marginata TaxID=1093978 RepID=A0AAV4IZV0_9GAST|nr:hypothetical protein ElyMa_006764500 [Elysia marginata]
MDVLLTNTAPSLPGKPPLMMLMLFHQYVSCLPYYCCCCCRSLSTYANKVSSVTNQGHAVDVPVTCPNSTSSDTRTTVAFLHGIEQNNHLAATTKLPLYSVLCVSVVLGASRAPAEVN